MEKIRCIISDINHVHEIDNVEFVGFNSGYLICRNHCNSKWNFDNMQICIRKINKEIYKLYAYQGTVNVHNNLVSIYSPRIKISKNNILNDGDNDQDKILDKLVDKDESSAYDIYKKHRYSTLNSKNYMLDFLKGI